MSESVDLLLEHAERRAATFTAGDLPAPPSRRLAVVTCMDARIDVHAILGLREGEAHVIRNAGGIPTDDVLRSLAISQAVLGTREVLLVQHTRCGMLGAEEDDLRERIAAAGAAAPPGPLGTFDDLDRSVRRSVQHLRDSGALVDSEGVRGFVYDVATGRLREVV